MLGLTPVYDNGNAFFNKRSIAQFEKRLDNEQQMKEDAYGTLVCTFTDDGGNHIHPAELIASQAYEDCNNAVIRFFDKYDAANIENIFAKIPAYSQGIIVLPEKQKLFYQKMLEYRIHDILAPTWEKLK